MPKTARLEHNKYSININHLKDRMKQNGLQLKSRENNGYFLLSLEL